MQARKICNFFIRLINLYQEIILTDDKVLNNNNQNDKTSHSEKNAEHLFFILEDAQNFDNLSIEFSKILVSNFDSSVNNISIVFTYQESLFMHDEEKDKFGKSPEFQTDEINSFYMHNIIKHKEISKIIKFLIVKSNLGNSKIQEIGLSKIEKTLINIIISKSFRGNALFIFEITESLLNSKKYIQYLSTEILVTSELLKMNEFQDWGEFKIPILIEKIVGSLIDSLSLKEIILLKNASVIGNIFDISSLMDLNPFSKLNFDDVFNLFQNMEIKGILEFLHNDLDKKIVVFKFSIPFFRDILYQRMLIEQKNEVHLKVVSNFQKQKFSYYSPSKEVKILENHLRNSERTLLVRLDEDESVEDFYTKIYSNNNDDGNLNKYAIKKAEGANLNLNNLKILLVKNITNNLKQMEFKNRNFRNKNKINLMSGHIEKKSDKNITWER